MYSQMKVGRNQPCPCGSGRKFKRCHGRPDACQLPPPARAPVPPLIAEQIAAHQAKEIRRQQQQGLGRPIISNMFHGQRLVAVGNRLHYSDKWVTFHDFLRDYVRDALGTGWVRAEGSKPSEQQHPFVRWALQSFEDYRRLGSPEGQITSAPATGAMMAFLGLSYNLYLTAHNVTVQEALIRRLKNSKTFWGALYETYVAAAFIKAGFAIEFEDERDGDRTHCEFVATHMTSGQRFSVEAKARDPESQAKRLAAIESSPNPNFGLVNKLYSALGKHADHPRVVFIELSLPVELRAENRDSIVRIITEEIRSKESTLQIDGQPAPPAYLFVTNHPFHHRLDSLAGAPAVLALGFNMPGFGYDFTFRRFHEYVAAREQHGPMIDLMKSIATHREIPSTFDGEMPEFAFSDPVDHPRLEIGKTYLVPDGSGKEVSGVLEHAIMMEHEKQVWGAYRTAAGLITVTCPVTDKELQAYRAYPDTFFGRKLEPSRRAEDAVDLFDFFYETYQHTPRERLLEFLKGAPDFNELTKLSQRDLAIECCERWTWSAVHEQGRQEPVETSGIRQSGSSKESSS